MITLLINVLIIIVVGAICFYWWGLVCLLAILQRLLPALGVGF